MFQARGPAQTLLRSILEDPAFRRCRVTRTGRADASRLVVALGQVHPVLRGRYEKFQARRIAMVQAWIYRAALCLLERHGLHAFGQEGLSFEGVRGGKFRMEGALLDDIRRALQRSVPENFLRQTAVEWRRALRSGDGRTASRTVATLNGLTLLQAVHGDAALFPIEQRSVHGTITAAIDALQQRIARAEASAVYQASRSKGGKNLTKQEYAAAMERNTLVKEWNALLKHPERDRAIFREIVEAAGDQVLTVFVLGEGHRSGMLRLAKREGPSDMLFVWVTPKALWWWKTMLVRSGWIIAAMIVAVGMYVFL
jgi:hypothetical protein